jgi:hypothetical protein
MAKLHTVLELRGCCATARVKMPSILAINASLSEGVCHHEVRTSKAKGVIETPAKRRLTNYTHT